jgi:prepilin-type N-terminal cleavage/methylation domain-containing protein
MQVRRNARIPGSNPQAGFTLLEMLVVITCLALAGVMILAQQPARLVPASDALRSLLIQGRLQAVSHGIPTVITFDAALREYRLRHAAGGTLAQLCDTAGTPGSSVRLADYRGVSQAGEFKGLIWLPTGSGRNCQGGGAYNLTVTLQQGRRQARIIVARGGRVRSEVELR